MAAVYGKKDAIMVKIIRIGKIFGIGDDVGLGIGSPVSGQLTLQKTKLYR